MIGDGSLKAITSTDWWHSLRQCLRQCFDEQRRIVALGVGHAVLAAALRAPVCPVDVAFLHGTLPYFDTNLRCVRLDGDGCPIVVPRLLPRAPIGLASNTRAIFPPPWVERSFTDPEVLGASSKVETLHDMLKKAMLPDAGAEEGGGGGGTAMARSNAWKHSLHSLVGELMATRRRQKTRKKRLNQLIPSQPDSTASHQGQEGKEIETRSADLTWQTILGPSRYDALLHQHAFPAAVPGLQHPLQTHGQRLLTKAAKLFARATNHYREKVIPQSLGTAVFHDSLTAATLGEFAVRYHSLLSSGFLTSRSHSAMPPAIASALAELDSGTLGLLVSLSVCSMHAVLKWLWDHRYELQRLEGLQSRRKSIAAEPASDDKLPLPPSPRLKSRGSTRPPRAAAPVVTAAQAVAQKLSSSGAVGGGAPSNASHTPKADNAQLGSLLGVSPIASRPQHQKNGEIGSLKLPAGGNACKPQPDAVDKEGDKKAKPKQPRRSSLDVSFGDQERHFALLQTSSYRRYWGMVADNYQVNDIVLAPPPGMHRMPFSAILPRPKQNPPSLEPLLQDDMVYGWLGLPGSPGSAEMEEDEAPSTVDACVKGSFVHYLEDVRKLVRRGTLLSSKAAALPRSSKGKGKKLNHSASPRPRRQSAMALAGIPQRRLSTKQQPQPQPQRRASAAFVPTSQRASLTDRDIRRRSSAFLRRFSLGSTGKGSVASSAHSDQDESPNLSTLIGQFSEIPREIESLLKTTNAAGQKQDRPVKSTPPLVHSVEEISQHSGVSFSSFAFDDAVVAAPRLAVDTHSIAWCYGVGYEVFSWAGLGMGTTAPGPGGNSRTIADCNFLQPLLLHIANVVVGKVQEKAARRGSTLALFRRNSQAMPPTTRHSLTTPRPETKRPQQPSKQGAPPLSVTAATPMTPFPSTRPSHGLSSTTGKVRKHFFPSHQHTSTPRRPSVSRGSAPFEPALKVASLSPTRSPSPPAKGSAAGSLPLPSRTLTKHSSKTPRPTPFLQRQMEMIAAASERLAASQHQQPPVHNVPRQTPSPKFGRYFLKTPATAVRSRSGNRSSSPPPLLNFTLPLLPSDTSIANEVEQPQFPHLHASHQPYTRHNNNNQMEVPEGYHQRRMAVTAPPRGPSRVGTASPRVNRTLYSARPAAATGTLGATSETMSAQPPQAARIRIQSSAPPEVQSEESASVLAQSLHRTMQLDELAQQKVEHRVELVSEKVKEEELFSAFRAGRGSSKRSHKTTRRWSMSKDSRPLPSSPSQQYKFWF